VGRVTDRSSRDRARIGLNVVDYVLDCFDKLAESWRARADELHTLAPGSEVGNTYNRCAEEIEMVGADLYVELDRLTPEQYAQLNRVTKQTVRRWCRLGLLDCFEDERGLLISRHAKRKMPEPES
jgi:hypothetical protein